VLHSMTHADLPPDDKCEADPKLEEQDSYVKGEVDEWCRIGWQAKEDCVPLNQCGEIFSLYIYFYAYTLWSAMIVFNLFVGIVLDAFSEEEETEASLTPEQEESFMDAWSDVSDGHTLPMSRLGDLLKTLSEPLGLAPNDVDDFEGSDIELEREIGQIPFMMPSKHFPSKLGEDFEMDIKDVAEALAKRAVRKKAEAAGGDQELMNSIYLSDDDPAKRMELERGLKEAQPYIQAYYDSLRRASSREAEPPSITDVEDITSDPAGEVASKEKGISEA